MDNKIRQAQWLILKTFAKHAKNFALAGGTALELFYLHHRFSRDLDFFSPEYDEKEILRLITHFSKTMGQSVRLENEFTLPGHARVKFFSCPLKGTTSSVKIDFVEDVLIKNPIVQKHEGVPVYDIQHLYMHKITTLTGTRLAEDAVGRERAGGRNESRDIVDVYYLSKKVEPLRMFLKKVSRQQQRGVVQWYRSYSRQQLKLDVLDLDIYNTGFDASEVIAHLDAEVGKFIQVEML